jgi:uncharacterized protein (DUF302 family)
MTEPLAFEVVLPQPYEQALDRVVDALKAQGFGILTRIDVRQTFKEKLDLEFRPYAILGACNPELAHRALSARADVGLLLPCTVTVESAGADRTLVRVGNPGAMMGLGGLADDPAIQSVASEARRHIEAVAAALAG